MRHTLLIRSNGAKRRSTCSKEGSLGKRTFDKFHCTEGCGAVMIDPLNAAINILARLDDEELHRWLPFTTALANFA